MKKLFLPLLAALTLLGLCSCTAQRACGRADEEKAFQLVMPELDRDGMLLIYFSNTELKRSFSRLYSAWSDSLWHRDVPEMQRIEQQKLLLYGQLFWELSGLENASGAGVSSKSLNQDGNIIHNRLFLAIDREQPGLINEFFGKSNSIDVEKSLGKLPSTTAFHASVYLHPEAIFNALKRCGGAGENLILDLGAAGEFIELLNTLKGVWSITVLDDRNKIPPVKIELPDETGTVFNLLKNNFAGKNSAKDDRVKFDLPPLHNVLALRKQKSTVFYFNTASEKIFEDAGKKPLSLHHTFPDLIKALPEQAAGIFYRSGEFDLTAEIFDLKNPAKSFSCAALSRENNGWLLTANGNTSFAEDQLFIVAALMKQTVQEILSPENEAKNVDKPDETGKNSVKDCSTPEQMELLSKILDDYLKKHGKLPEKSGIAGLKELFAPGTIPAGFLLDKNLPADKLTEKNCRFIYFYVSAPEGSDYPVLISNCPEHTEHFLVRFRSGEIKKFALERSGSMLRKIGFLHTVKKFDEAIFMELTRQGAEFDKVLQSQQ